MVGISKKTDETKVREHCLVFFSKRNSLTRDGCGNADTNGLGALQVSIWCSWLSISSSERDGNKWAVLPLI
jgi:hypothetical protein